MIPALIPCSCARVGMVFQKPNPFPKSIYDNVAYGPRIHGLAKNKAELDEIVEKALRRGAIWDEVKDRLNDAGTASLGAATTPVYRACCCHRTRGFVDG